MCTAEPIGLGVRLVGLIAVQLLVTLNSPGLPLSGARAILARALVGGVVTRRCPPWDVAVVPGRTWPDHLGPSLL